MKKLKRFLALFLVLSMMLSVAPFGAFASESTEPTGETTAPVADAPEGETQAPSATPAEANEEASTEIPSETGENGIMLTSGDEGVATADATITHMTTKPADHTTNGEPFPENTGGSYSFRIPAMVTLSDGTLVAAADARWNTTYDGGGLDTIVARSSNNGATWNYTFANYLGDNGNEYNGSSTCFIDPSLAVTADDTIYMLCDLYPYGVALNGNGYQTAPKYDTGFDANGNLLLSADNHASYSYYLKDGKIYNSSNNAVDGYTVDGKFNLFYNGTYQSNLFFSDSRYKVARTGYLYLTKSTNKGETWSDPILLPLKNDQEMVCLVGPGRGLVTGDGTIIFPVYSYAGDTSKYTGLIYSTDGITWNRTASFSQIISSEATMVELDNGNIRTFFRNDNATLCYADYKLGTNGMTDGWWGAYVDTGVKCNSDTELSAVMYTKTVNDQQVILVSAPAGPNAAGSDNNNGAYRSSGKIFAGLINDDENFTMTWQSSSVGVTPVATSAFSGSTYTAAQGFFAYSCLTELDNGSVAILYEDNQYNWGAGTNYGYTMAFKTYTESELEAAFGVTFDEVTDEDIDVPGSEGGNEDSSTVDVTLKVGETVTETIDGVVLEGSNADDAESAAIATVTWTGTEASEGGTTEKLTAATIPTSAGSVECYISDGNGNYLTLSNGALTNATSAADATKWTVTFFDTPTWSDNVNNYSRYRINSGSYYIDMNKGVLGVTTGTTNINHWYTAENGFFGGFAGTNGWQYANGSWTTVNASGFGNAKAYTVETVTGEATAASTAVTITGKAVGNTKVEVGTTTYNITVNADVANTVDVELKVGETQKFTEASGAYTSATTNPDTNIVKMELTTVEGTAETTVSTSKATELEDGATYIIRVYDTTYALSSNAGRGDWGTTTLAFETNTLTVNADHLWMLEASGDGYKLKNEDGYLNLGSGNNSAYLNDTGEVFTITSTTTGWTIGNPSGRYINALGGLDWYQTAGGWTGDGTRFDLYKVTTATDASTEVAFTGIAPGTTYAVVGNTQYNITVTGDKNIVDIELEVGETLTYTDTTGNYEGSDTIEYPDTTYASMTVADGYALKAVTTLESGKQYLIVNKANGTVLTDTEMDVSGDWGLKPGLATTGTASASSKELWTITSVDGGYTVAQNGKYLTAAGFEAHMSETATALTLTYSENDGGWVVYDTITGPALGHDAGGYYLTDNAGSNYVNGALGTADASNGYRHWIIYEILPLNTEISFTGESVGETHAVVGSTQYNITVEEYILDDEINDTNAGFTVNAELQRIRYNNLIAGVSKDLYTDESWPEYETARKNAYALLNNVDGAIYATEAEAQSALNELIAAIDALEAAKAKLVEAKTITVNYQLDGTIILTENYKVAKTATELTLPDTIVANKVAYSVSETQTGDDVVITDGVMMLNPDETHYNVAITKIGTLGDGFVGGANIARDEYVGTDQMATVLNNPVTEMTVTTGITYDLNLAGTLADGQYVEWSTDNTAVATVDENGLVNSVGVGTANIIANVYNADGSLAVVNTIPITVLENNYTDGDSTRLVALYVENIDNTAVWCMINGCLEDGAFNENDVFEVVEGELIYGNFKKSTGNTTDITTTTAFTFFGDPDEAHALVAMTASSSFGDYYLLHDDQGNRGEGAEYYVSMQTSGAGYWQAVGLNNNNSADWDIVRDMVDWAIQHGCDGGQGFTRRQAEGDLCQNLTFISDPMPKIDKEVNGVLPTSRKQADFRHYTEGMVAAVNELVYFEITVTLEMPFIWSDDAETLSAINYTNAIVEDTILKGAYLYTKELDQADGVYDGEIEEAYRTQTQVITDQLNAAWTDAEKEAGKRVLTFYLLYEIQESDIPKFYIDNIAYLSYNYRSDYSTGAQAGAADAEARISVVGTAIDDVVIDFGQSFVYEGHEYTSITDGESYTFEGLTNTHLKGAYVDGTYNADGTYEDGKNDLAGIAASKATANYGTVKVTRTATGGTDDKGYPEYTYTVTYTPTQILQGVDTVLIYGYGENNQEKIINGFLVYPATTVYYEEGFILSDGHTWNADNAKKATVEQTFELLGDSQFNEHGELTHKVSNKKHAYGYDPIYANEAVAKSYISATDVGQTTTFTFTGNGFELFADCTTSTGYVSVQVMDSTGKRVKFFTVNTVVAEELTETGDSTDGQNTNMDSLPIVSWHSENHDTYTVIVKKVVNTDTVNIDGVRVFNTVDESDYVTEGGTANSPFAIDREDNPEFYQLRDYVLSALNITDTTSADYGTLAEMAGQVYEQVSKDTEAPTSVILANGAYNTDVRNLLDNGPKNEVYLHAGETLVFKVTTNRMMQIGLKTPVDATTYSISYKLGDTSTTVASNKAMSTTVDMFYELGNSALETAAEYTVTITNNGINILAVTDLKICDDPSAAFVALTAEDIETALVAMGYGNTCDDGHSYETVVTAPTCTEAGYTTYTCTVCGDSYVGDETAALGHSHDAVVTAPTCTEAGYTTYTCTVCGDSYVGDETAALGHSHEAVVTDPTCTEQGYTTYTCHCGDTYVDDYVDATGHNYAKGSCTDCGEKDPNYRGSSNGVRELIVKVIGWLIGLIKP